MTTNNIKQSLTKESVPANVADLNEEKLETISAGLAIGPYNDLVPRKMPKKRDEPKDGGATGSW